MTSDPVAPIVSTPVPSDARDLPQRGAGVGIRAVATAIDTFVFLLIAIVFFHLWGRDGECSSSVHLTATFNDDTTSLCGGPAGGYFAAVFAYWFVFEAAFGATIGKFATGLRVINPFTGSRASIGAVLLRTLLRVVDGLAFYLVAAIAVWASPRNQRVGDMAAKTLVVARRRG